MILFRHKRSLIKKLLGLWLVRKLWRARKHRRGIPPQRLAISAGMLGAASLATYFMTRRH